ncbi:hypothetical protein TCDM_12691 [Trypanosoma cruzi Dm28c]|uniref:ATPase n=1 Tax=Trypanosoma cruzi Dm28c TaxID=1416333 RepID=V5CKB1_TRYCR|nr:hypothetical protein TCDM_12691 [Trypanosoma cruzi Dm28c]
MFLCFSFKNIPVCCCFLSRSPHSFFYFCLKYFYCFFFLVVRFFFFHPPSLFLFAFWGQSLWTFFLFYSSLFNCLLLHSSCEGCRVFPPNCSTRTPTDTLMTTALCASPAARMRRGRDERRTEGAVTCGRATRACGAAHTFLPSCFFSLRPGRADTRSATHTATPCRRVFLLFLLCVCISLPSDVFSSFAALTLPME